MLPRLTEFNVFLTNMNKTTLVLGASLNPNRYANIAIKRLIGKDIPVLAIGLREGKVFDVTIDTKKKNVYKC